MGRGETIVRAAVEVLYGYLQKGVHIVARKELVDKIQQKTQNKPNDIIDALSQERDGWNRVLYSPAQGYVLSKTGLKFALKTMALDKGGTKTPKKESDYYGLLENYFKENYSAEVVTNRGQSGRKYKRPDLQILIPPGGGGFNPNLYEIWNIEIKDDPLQFGDIEQTDGYRRAAHYVFLMSTIDPASSPPHILEEISERGIGLFFIKETAGSLSLELRHVPAYQTPIEADIEKTYRDVFGYEVCPLCGVFFKLPTLKKRQWADKAYANRLMKRTSPFGGQVLKKYFCDRCILLLNKTG